MRKWIGVLGIATITACSSTSVPLPPDPTPAPTPAWPTPTRTLPVPSSDDELTCEELAEQDATDENPDCFDFEDDAQ